MPIVVDDVDIDKGMSMGRTDLATVKQFVYDEFDAAANALPTTYSGIKRATKGAALVMLFIWVIMMWLLQRLRLLWI